MGSNDLIFIFTDGYFYGKFGTNAAKGKVLQAKDSIKIILQTDAFYHSKGFNAYFRENTNSGKGKCYS